MRVCTTCDSSYPDTERFCPRDGTPLRSSDASADLVGTVIAERYEVLRKLGEGGMGQVYLAEHVRLKRKSAVKIVHPRLAQDADALSRFNREAANACQIQHPNVAAIYDFGETTDGIVYIAMEYVEGDSLSRVLASAGALAPVRAADIARQIADGLDVAHRLGIVHRDLKPDNILIGAHHDGRDWVRVVDFGISKAVDRDGQSVTQTGQVVGTPDYMSPEQLGGENVDYRSDIYSLAIVMFNMLTGELPFHGASTHASMMLRLSEPPRRLAAARPSVAWTDELQAVIDRAMEVSPDRRYSTASAFAAALTEAARHIAPAVAPVPNAIAGPSVVPPASVPPAGVPLASVPLASVPLPNLPAANLPQPSGPRDAPRGTVPVSLAVPAPSGLTSTELSAIEVRLARLVGPIAKVLVRRAAATATSKDALLTILSAEIDDEGERARFRRET